MLYIVATPIGNLDDITLRAVRVLTDCDILLAEDTRHTAKLLNHLSIARARGSVISVHDHNETQRSEWVLEKLADGLKLALVTDAGTPGISDPGYRLVRDARNAGHEVIPIPGACAAVAALSASGLPTDRFTFVGFPPKKAAARRRWLDEVATAPGTLVLYAAARDVPKVLADVRETRGDVLVVVAREITKRYEEWLTGTVSETLAQWEASPRKGEVTLIVDRPPERVVDDASLLAMLREKTVKDVVALTGASKRRVYQLSLRLKRD
jgi:16S rRNA (cytidine1402-2'-O)-methyltransferase